MVHPTDSELLALVHHEASVDRPAMRAHAASCEPCQLRYRTLAQQDGEIASLLTLLDAPTPIVPLAGITRRARLGRRPRSVVAAAAAILITATAAAAVIPGTPLHRYFHDDVGKPALQTRPALRPAPAPADTAGVTVAADTDVIIALREPQSAGEINVVWHAGAPAVSVRAIGGDVGYTVRAGQVQIENRRPASRYDITLPPTITAVTLMVGDKVVWQSTKQANAGRSRQPMSLDLSKMEQRR
jgi:hypothetical protein